MSQRACTFCQSYMLRVLLYRKRETRRCRAPSSNRPWWPTLGTWVSRTRLRLRSARTPTVSRQSSEYCWLSWVDSAFSSTSSTSLSAPSTLFPSPTPTTAHRSRKCPMASPLTVSGAAFWSVYTTVCFHYYVRNIVHFKVIRNLVAFNCWNTQVLTTRKP